MWVCAKFNLVDEIVYLKLFRDSCNEEFGKGYRLVSFDCTIMFGSKVVIDVVIASYDEHMYRFW